jgi:nitrogen regulatory protein PII
VKKVEAYIQPFKFDEVKEKLGSIDVRGLTVSEVKRVGRPHGGPEVYRGVEASLQVTPSLKVEVVVPSFKAEQVVEAIERAARTGGGTILVLPIADAVRIRTGDRGEDAI